MQEWSVPATDSYSFTAAGQEYLAHEWLAAVFFHLVHRAAGVDGLILAKSLLLGAVTFFLALAARAAGARMTAIVPSLGLGLFIAASRFSVRPHIFSWLFTAIVLWAWMRYRSGPRDWRWLAALIPLQVVWSNTHGGGVLGLLLLGLILAGEGLDALKEGGRPAWSRMKAPGLALAAGMAASLLNPYGPRLILLPLRLTSMDLYMERIFEWQPPFHESFRGTTMMAGWIVLACGLLFALAPSAGGSGPGSSPKPRRGPGGGARRWLAAFLRALPVALLLIFFGLRLGGDGWWEEQPARILLFALPALTAASALAGFRRADLPLHLLAATFMTLSLRHNRAVADAALVCSVVLAVALSRALPLRKEAGSRGPFPKAWIPASLLLASSAAVALFGYPHRMEGSVRKSGLGLGPHTPVCAVDFIEGQGLTGNAFVSYGYAAMLVHRMNPRILVNIDSRNEVYGEGIYRGYLGALRSAASMEAHLQGRAIDLFLLNYGDPVPEVGRHLMESGDWAPVFFDSESFVLVRRVGAPPSLLAAHEYRVLRPSVLGPTRITRHNAAEALAEADRSIDECPGSTFGTFYRGKALMALGRFREAAETGRMAVKLDPSSATAWADLGLAHAALGDREEALRCYRRALKEDPGNDVARRNLEILGGP